MEPVYRVSKKITFSAAHFIEGHTDPFTGLPGKCCRFHGHNYSVTLTVESTAISNGILIDYYVLGKFLKEEVEIPFDHQNLNELAMFQDRRTSAENIAKIVYEKWKKWAEALPSYIKICSDFNGVKGTIDRLKARVEVNETETSAAFYGDF